jgi:hypothetical protein
MGLVIMEVGVAADGEKVGDSGMQLPLPLVPDAVIFQVLLRGFFAGTCKRYNCQ